MIIAVGIAFGVGVLALILTLLVRRQLREKYALLWLVIGLLILVLGVFPGLLFGLSDALGVVVPSNLVFALALALLIGVALHLSWELSRAEEEIRRVAEDVAILETQVRALREEITHQKPTTRTTRAAPGGGLPLTDGARREREVRRPVNE